MSHLFLAGMSRVGRAPHASLSGCGCRRCKITLTVQYRGATRCTPLWLQRLRLLCFFFAYSFRFSPVNFPFSLPRTLVLAVRATTLLKLTDYMKGFIRLVCLSTLHYSKSQPSWIIVQSICFLCSPENPIKCTLTHLIRIQWIAPWFGTT